MTITLQPVLDFGLEPSATLITEGFTGYFVPIQIPLPGLLAMARLDHADLTLSRVILDDDKPVGVALINRRGWTSRLGAMGIIPDARGKRIGQAAMLQLLTEARERGDKAMVLEVIEQNTAGVRLYTKVGFQTIRRLVGFSAESRERSPQPSAPEPQRSNQSPIEQIDVLQVSRALVAHQPADIPWQISGESLAASAPPTVAYRNQDSFVALTNPEAPAIVIRNIVTLPNARRQGSATGLIQAVMSRYPDKTWRVSPTFPEELAGLYDNLGFEREKISQWQMTAPL